MGVFCTKVDCLERVFTVQGRTYTFCSESDFKIHSIIDDDVKSVLELLDLIGVTNNLNLALITRLEYSLSLDDLPDAFFLLGEGRVLSWDL